MQAGGGQEAEPENDRMGMRGRRRRMRWRILGWVEVEKDEDRMMWRRMRIG